MIDCWPQGFLCCAADPALGKKICSRSESFSPHGWEVAVLETSAFRRRRKTDGSPGSMEAPSSPDPQILGLVWRTHRLPSCVGICRQALQHSRSPDQCGGRGGVADADDVRVDRGVLPLQSLPFPSGRAGALLPTNNAHMLPCSCVNSAHCVNC